MESISELISRARAAQAEFEKTATQESVDAIVKAIAKTVYENAEPLAKLAAEESGMGLYEDKINKNKGKARIIWSFLKDKKSVGVISRDAQNLHYGGRASDGRRRRHYPPAPIPL